MVTAASGRAAPVWFVTAPERLALVWAGAAWGTTRNRGSATNASKRGLTGSPCVYGCADSTAVRVMTTRWEFIRLLSRCQNDLMCFGSVVRRYGSEHNRGAGQPTTGRS